MPQAGPKQVQEIQRLQQWQGPLPPPEVLAKIVSKIPGCRPLDAGELSNATAIEAFTAVLLQPNVRYQTRVAPKLTGIRQDPRALG